MLMGAQDMKNTRLTNISIMLVFFFLANFLALRLLENVIDELGVKTEQTL